MKLPLFLFATLTLPLAATAQTVFAQSVPDNNQVVPGARIGRVFLGDSRAAVRRRLGKPLKTFALPGGMSSELWRAKTTGAYSIRHALEVVYKSGVVTQIETTNPIFQTKSGLSIDDFESDWSKIYGKPVSRVLDYAKRGGITQIYYDWKRSGIALETRAQGEGEENITLIVHRKGVAVVPDPGGRPSR